MSVIPHQSYNYYIHSHILLAVRNQSDRAKKQLTKPCYTPGKGKHKQCNQI